MNYIIGMSFGLRGIFKIATTFMDQASITKIKVLNSSNIFEELLTYINEENLQIKFGGKAKDLQFGGNNVFPPVMPSNNYRKEGDNFLITNEEYKIRCLIGVPERPVEISEEYLKIWENEKKIKEKEEEKQKQKQKN